MLLIYFRIILAIVCSIHKITCTENNVEPTTTDLNAFDSEMILPNGAVKKVSFFRTDESSEEFITLPEGKILEEKIIGGKEISLSEAPYQVGIMKIGSGIMCGGALYNENTVITAAHCFVKGKKVDTTTTKEDLIYVIGKSNLIKVESCSEVLRMAFHIAVHPKFVADPLENQQNDIAIVRLDKPVCSNKNGSTSPIQTIPIMSPNITRPDKGYVSGWGYTVKRKDSNSIDATKYSRILKKAELNIYQESVCKKKFTGTAASLIASHDSYFCAGVPDGSADACQGDSGGPVTCNVNNVAYLCGIVSIGLGCGQSGVPAFYTDVARFHSWIEETSSLSDDQLMNKYDNASNNIFVTQIWITLITTTIISNFL